MLSILRKVEKLICHEVSARKLGSIAEADAFAAKARQLLLQHRVERLGGDHAAGDRACVNGAWEDRQEIDCLP